MKSERILIVSPNSNIWDELNFDNFENSRQIAGSLQEEKNVTYKGKRSVNKKVYK